MMSKKLFALLLLLCSIAVSAKDVKTGDWNVIPLPQSVEVVAKPAFVINAHTTVYYPTGDAVQKRNAEFLVSYVKTMTGIGITATDRSASNQIRLGVASVAGGDEAYDINVTKKLITLNGATHAAVFRGLQTIHWHLTEDQGWRIEIKKYPLLTEIGSKRKQTVLPGGKEYDGKPVSGYYTQDEARDIVRYAAERHITVIPEVDMPGHIQSALAAYPQLGCTGGPYDVFCHFGVIREVMCAGQPFALQLAKDVINEIMDIFPSPYIHIGGDECPKERWKECERCQAKIAALGLKDIEGHSKEEQLQSWFMGEVAKEIKARGRKILGWDEILDGTPSKDITVIAWTSQKASIRSAKEGHKTVVAPITNFYFSNPRINQITGIPSIKRVYDVNPAFAELTDSEKANVIGAEGCIWTEWVPDTKKLEWELLPRLAALAEVQWTNQEQREFGSFAERLLHMHDIYRKMNLNYKEDIEKAIITDGKTAK